MQPSAVPMSSELNLKSMMVDATVVVVDTAAETVLRLAVSVVAFISGVLDV